MGNLETLLGSGAVLADLMGWVGANFDASVTWKDVQWVREQWKGRLVIKGILDADDAREAAANGADGIVVSNHGGRQLDGVLSNRDLRARLGAAGQQRAADYGPDRIGPQVMAVYRRVLEGRRIRDRRSVAGRARPVVVAP